MSACPASRTVVAAVAAALLAAGCSPREDRLALAAEWRDCVDGTIIVGWTLNEAAPSPEFFGPLTGVAIRECGTGGLSAGERFRHVAGSARSIAEDPGGFVREFEARGGHLGTR